MSINLREELQHPTTTLGKRYLTLVLFTIVLSVLFFFSVWNCLRPFTTAKPG